MTSDAPARKDVKLSCRNVWKIYGETPAQFFEAGNGAVDSPVALSKTISTSDHIVANADVSFDVHVSEIFVIMGLSGSGKSTIVRCISRLVEPTAGEVLLDGEDVLKKSDAELIEIRRHKMGMVFQSFGLMPHLNVIENIAFPLKLQGIGGRERYAQAERVIELVGLQGRESNFPNELSGGQQQRVGIARSLAVEPEVWLLDEPFSALDTFTRSALQQDVAAICKDKGITLVLVTHDIDEAVLMSDRVFVMDQNPGRIIDEILVDLSWPRKHMDQDFQRIRKKLLLAFKGTEKTEPPRALDGGRHGVESSAA